MKCPSCLNQSWKNGYRKSEMNGRLVAQQVFKCKYCQKQFTARSLSMFSRMRFPAKTVRFAVKLHFNHDLSCYAIASLLSSRGEPVSHVTVYKWLKKYGPVHKQMQDAKKLRQVRKQLMEGGAQ
jgi:transposase-like protein